MLAIIAKRLLLIIPVMGVVSFVVFGLLYLSPTDPAAVIAGDYATQEAIEEIRTRLGLDQPLLFQYVHWLGNVLTGDLGTSIYENRPVTTVIAERFEPTISLAISIVIFATLFSVPLGLFSAWFAGRLVDRLTMIFAAIGTATPLFIFAYALVAVLAVKLGLLPAYGFVSIREGVGPFLYHIILPTLSAGLAYSAIIARVTRASSIEALNQDYMRTARAKGLGVRKMIFGHALPNASIPVVTVIGTRFATLLGGVVVAETVFAIPGIGRLSVDAILHSDFPVVQGVILVMSLVYVMTNLVVDILYTILDPRVRQ
ncbi:ABC transporter permease [Acuticoccus sp. M5D2P5]|uniref:ABC transporter permease n=1 Tax=Acuticoccus kalidii TaxID=2910977 RepID=UPI001F4125D1|nr:ABC transporter permease [Acuticoccus kalidii]MCF3933386.1 ABC transporter permease [Acuticoccus kalidii]